MTHQPRLGAVASGTDLTVLKITPEQLEKIEQEAPHISSVLYKELARTLAEQLVLTAQMAVESD